MLNVRPAAVAGMFYPRDAATLREQLDDCLGAARGAGLDRQPKVLVVPHAGYVYSGPIAGQAYARLARWANRITRVVLLGPAHRVALSGLAVPTTDAFETPLGQVAIDHIGLAALADLPQVVRDDRAHALEHSLEVQLPFLQTVLGPSFSLLPLAVGSARPEQVAEVVERLWGGDETLVVVSSDLSHYLPYEHAQATDRTTVARIAALVSDLDPYEACGAHALNGALLVAKRRALRAQLLDLRNSGDTAGDRRRVVGYASLALLAAGETAVVDEDDEPLGSALLSRAHNTIATRLGFATDDEPHHPALRQPGATFVTLHDARGQLRGCIGRLEAVALLDDDVRHNAAAAAFRDPRFEPLVADEWAGLQIEVSLLGKPEPLPVAPTQHELLAHVEPERDGLILEWRGHRSTFLPQVWSQLPQPQDFLAALLRKAGLAPQFWAEDVKVQRYRVRKFEREPVRGAVARPPRSQP